MARLSIEELIAHCNRSLDRLPSGSKLYQEHESTRAYLKMLRHFTNTGTGYIGELMKLIRENPDLPIVPMVDSEIVADDYCARWMGSWGNARKSKYLRGEERIYFYDECDMEEVLEEVAGCDWYEKATDEECLEKYRGLQWVECIEVDINLPD